MARASEIPAISAVSPAMGRLTEAGAWAIAVKRSTWRAGQLVGERSGPRLQPSPRNVEMRRIGGASLIRPSLGTGVEVQDDEENVIPRRVVGELALFTSSSADEFKTFRARRPSRRGT